MDDFTRWLLIAILTPFLATILFCVGWFIWDLIMDRLRDRP